jgi:hypothetical protein
VTSTEKKNERFAVSQVVETRERPPSVKTCAETRFAAPKSFREINKDTGRDD